ncbi:MAG TPA: homocysteine S-methyltransferase family protein [Terracidiphilus sp.]|nr:homocysteine S-methyltransferase family protein [Terracidiphilus sp.]
MSRFGEWLACGLMISDGAWGTQLQARGLASGTTPDTWNLTHAEQVESVARAYVEAGSQVILTNTFRANAVAMHSSTEAELDAINRAGVAISKQAAGKQALVFASIGPTGKILMSGEIGGEQVTAIFAAQAQSLAVAGADALLIETMSDIEEARLAVEAARRTGLPVLASFAFDSGKNKDRTMMGATPEAVAAAMVEAGADAVGANCGVGVELSVPICKRLCAACDLPVWIKPNAGLPIIEGTAIHYATSADYFASHYAALAEAGASFVGSCCGSTPDFIRALVAAHKTTS